jgi:hypothetical protein
VTGSFQGPGGSRTVQATAVPGALLGEMVEAALWVLDLEPGSEFDVPVVSQDGTTSPVRIRVMGERRVQVPAGTFEALEVEVVGAGQNQRILVTRARPRFTVKIEVVDQPVVTVLTRVTEGSP